MRIHLADRKKMRGYRSMIFSVVIAIGTLDSEVAGVKKKRIEKKSFKNQIDRKKLKIKKNKV